MDMEWLERTARRQTGSYLASIGDAVIATDTGGRATNMNAVAESLTGWTTSGAMGQPLDTVFRIVNEQTRPVENPVEKVLLSGCNRKAEGRPGNPGERSPQERRHSPGNPPVAPLRWCG